jgi:uncharacterized membrane protein YfcA
MDLALAGVLLLGLVAGTVGGVIGFGTSIMLLPALVLAFGPYEAVPIMAVGSVMANATRAAVWWRELDWRAVTAYGAGAIPGAVLGASTLVALSGRLIEALLGAFFLAMIGVRRWMKRQHWRLDLRHLAGAGAGVGFLTGLVVSTGPINTPFFLAYGLTRGAFLGTEALGSLLLYAAKAVTFRSLGAMPWDLLLKGLVVGCSLIAGSLLSKRIVLAVDARRFERLMDGMLVVAGLTMVWSATQSPAR